MKNVEIKKVRLEELDKLQEISRQTFHETLSDQNSTENLMM
jgi:hypothetical protein